MRQGCELTVRSPARSESVVYELSGQSIHENLSVTCKGTATQGSGSPKAGSDERTPKRRGGRPHGRRSAAAPGASAEPARWTAGWRRLRPSDADADAPSAAGPGRAGSDSHGSFVTRQRWRWTRRRSPTNVARSKISSSDSSCPEQDWRIVTIIQSWNRVTLRAAKRLP